MPPVQTVFVLVLENQNWTNVLGNTNLPFVNHVLLPAASYCNQYCNPPALHPSLPNYLWLEAGTNFGIFDDNDPVVNHQAATNHLVSLLRRAGISWKSYQEDISGTDVPLLGTNAYTPRHNPVVYFDDVTGSNDSNCAYGIAHIRPYSELASDLANNTVARYNFITPDLCHDMHDDCPPLYNHTQQADNWLASEVPKLLNAAAFTNHGALFILWDEGLASDGPVGMMLLSPLARGHGYHNCIYYTHGSLLRTLQEIFGVGPLLGDAAQATDLADLFAFFGFSNICRLTNGAVQLTAMGITPGRTNLVLASTNLKSWLPVSTNSVLTNTFTVIDTSAANANTRFYRLRQLP